MAAEWIAQLRRLPALWALYGRRVASGRPVDRAASRAAFAAFRELQQLVERRLAG